MPSVTVVAEALIGRYHFSRASLRCRECDQPISSIDRILGRDTCSSHRAELNARREQLRRRYLGAITSFDLDAGPSDTERRILDEILPAALGDRWHARVATSMVLYLIDQAIQRNALPVDDEQRIEAAASVVRINLSDVIAAQQGLSAELRIARANSGRLDVNSKPSIKLRRREVCYEDVPAGWMSPAGSGVAVRPGLAIPRGAPVGPRLPANVEPLDSRSGTWEAGRLLITDQRLLFEGNHLSFQVPHRRLAGFRIYRDAIQVRIAGRHAEPVLRVAAPLVAVAVGNAASARSSVRLDLRAGPIESLDSLRITLAGSAK